MADPAPAWIAVDWGTSNLRAWAIGAAGEVLGHERSDNGMARLAPDEFEPALIALVGRWLGDDARLPVIACGMVGARQGWAEAPYVATPCAPPGPDRAARPQATDPRIDPVILPGVCQARPPDVMRGEETQIAGLLAAEPDFDGILCLPGTHTKWVHLSAGEIVSFRTFMTGELFALLTGQSVLRSVTETDGWDDAAFAGAVSDALSSPQQFAARLFALRAGALLDALPPETARARLSGMLLGLELAGARSYWLGREIAIAGAAGLAGLYATALAGQGAAARIAGGEDLALAGLRAAYAALGGARTAAREERP